MIITKLITGPDNKSYFEDFDCGHDSIQPLGKYLKKYSASGIMFRNFEAGAVFEMHNAPQPQYIIYLKAKLKSLQVVVNLGFSKQVMFCLQQM